MSDPVAVQPVSALSGQSRSGFATVADAGPTGMITLRGDQSAPALVKAVKALTGCAMPAPRRFTAKGDFTLAWMGPDELMIFLPYADAPAAVAGLTGALGDLHSLAVNVSDMRSRFTITGAKAAEVIMKLGPIDVARMAPDEIRRSRAGQEGAAVWKSGPEEWSLIAFRSVSAYMFGLLEHAAMPGSELFPV